MDEHGKVNTKRIREKGIKVGKIFKDKLDSNDVHAGCVEKETGVQDTKQSQGARVADIQQKVSERNMMKVLTVEDKTTQEALQNNVGVKQGKEVVVEEEMDQLKLLLKN